MRSPGRRRTKWGIGLLLVSILALLVHRGSCSESQSTDDGNLGTIIGIDLGNTYSRVAVMSNGKAAVILTDQGQRFLPSYVTFTDQGPLVGIPHAGRLTKPPENTITHTKYLLGRNGSDPIVQALIKNLPYRVVNEGTDLGIIVDVNGIEESFSPEEITIMIIGKLKKMAEDWLGKQVTQAVISVPPGFDDDQRDAVRTAGEKAGLTVLRVMNDPVAAGMAYMMDKDERESSTIVYDLGGTTLDVSLVFMDQGVFEILKTTSVSIGGEDFTQRIVNHFVRIFNKINKVDISSDRQALGKLYIEAERAKRNISSRMSSRIQVDSLYNGINFTTVLTRSKFEELNQDLFKTLLKPLESVLKDAKMKKVDIDDILLVGGSSQIPKVKQIVEEFFNGKWSYKSLNREEVVVIGASRQASVFSDQDPDESCGLFFDVQPFGLGIETSDGHTKTIIARNVPIPTRRSQIFSTAFDNQTSMLLRVVEGDRPMAKDNVLRGTLELVGIPPAPRGIPRIQVAIELDANYIIRVIATDEDGKLSQSVTIPLTDFGKEINWSQFGNISAEYEEHSEADKPVFERMDLRIDLESYLAAVKNYTVSTEERQARLNPNERKAILDAVKWTENWLDKSSKVSTSEDFKKQKLLLSHVAQPLVDDIPYEKRARVGGAVTGKARIHDEL